MLTHAINRTNLPPWLIASRHFNRNPKTIEIQGVRNTHKRLFEMLDEEPDRKIRAHVFHGYMNVAFQLHQWKAQRSPNSRRSLKNSYLRFLRGWMFDSNSVEGAVIKGWAESRFGLSPTYHRERIEPDTPAYTIFELHRAQGSTRTCAIDSQFDLLYEYVQYELARRFQPSWTLTLYRGVYDFEEHRVIEKGSEDMVLWMNNMSSFTLDFERAWEFGTTVISADVPLSKIFYLSGILPTSLLLGEQEALVIGGEYDVILHKG